MVPRGGYSREKGPGMGKEGGKGSLQVWEGFGPFPAPFPVFFHCWGAREEELRGRGSFETSGITKKKMQN